MKERFWGVLEGVLRGGGKGIEAYAFSFGERSHFDGFCGYSGVCFAVVVVRWEIQCSASYLSNVAVVPCQ